MSLILLLLCFLGFLSALRRWVVSINYVPSPSMAPAIEPGDLVLVNHRAYANNQPIAKGEIVVFSPRGTKTRIVKRVLGLPGERITYGGKSVTVPPFHYFLVGDNHSGSVDSRSFGPIPRHRIIGRATRILGNVLNAKRPAHILA